MKEEMSGTEETKVRGRSVRRTARWHLGEAPLFARVLSMDIGFPRPIDVSEPT